MQGGENNGVALEREDSEAVAISSELRWQEEELDSAIGVLAQVGNELKETQGQVDEAKAHQRELGRQARKLDAMLEAQKQSSARSHSRFEDQVRVAYKGGELEGLLVLLQGLLGGEGTRGSISATLQTTRLITASNRSIQNYKDTKHSLHSTLQQIEDTKGEYREFGEESQALVEELEGRKSELRSSVEKLGFKRGRLQERLAQLEAEEKAGLLERPPAAGRGEEGRAPERGAIRAEEQNRDDERRRNVGQSQDNGQIRDEQNRQEEEGKKQARERELEIARDDIASRPVEPVPYEEYVRIYKDSAERYGFARDWYVLAAVGKIESNHGENMGSSSAGAMGPMQFLPSTWSSYGVDGDGDGEANIMNPEDAIPAAAAYLKAGDAPDDWYAALFTYNRAGWYVEEVLAIAENYRRIHGDGTVGPYLEPATAPTTKAPPPPEPKSEPDDSPEAGGEDTKEEHPLEGVPSPPEKSPRYTNEGFDTKEETVLEPEARPRQTRPR